MIAFFRHWAKGFIWFIVVAFVLATFLGSASIFFLLDSEGPARRSQGPETPGEEADLDRNPRLDSTEPVARISLDGQKAVLTEGDHEKRLNQQEMMRGQSLPEEARKFWRPIVLDNMVDEELVLLRARAAEVDVSEEVEKQLLQLFSQIGKDDYLRRTGQTEAEVRALFEERIKYQTMVSQVREGRPVSEEEARAFYLAHIDEFRAEGAAEPRPFEEVREQVERRVRADIRPEHVREYYETHKVRWKGPERVHLLHFALDLRSDARMAASTPSPEEVREYYESHLGDYAERPRVDFAHVFVDPKHPDFMDAARPTDDEVREYYDLNRDEFTGEEQVRLSQILLEGADASSKADSVMARLRSGEPFAKVAQDVSADRSTRSKGGDMGWVASLDLPEELASLAFQLDPGRISDPLKVGARFHVLHVADRRDGVVQPLEAVRGQIVEELAEQKRWELAEERAEEIAEEAREDGADFAALAREHSHAASRLSGGEIGEVVLGENPVSNRLDEVGTEGFLDFAIQRALREAEVGDVAGPVRSFKGFHVLDVQAKPEPAPRPLDEVREMVARAARKAKAEAAIAARIEEVREAVGATHPEVADPEEAVAAFRRMIREHSESVDVEELGGDWGPVYLDTTTPPEVPTAVRGELVSWNGLSRRVVDAVDDLVPGELSKPVDLSGKRHLFMVAEVLPPEYAPLEDVEDEIRQALYPHVTEEEMREYFEENRGEFETSSGGDSLSHVLLTSREDAEKVIEEIRTGEASFEEIAGGPRNMDKSAAARGGKVEGRIAIPSIKEAVEKAQPGKVYPQPVKSPVGWHVLRVEGKQTKEALTFEDVKDQIEEKLLTEKQREAERWWIEELKNRAEIEILLEGGGGMGGLQSLLGGMGSG